MKISLITLHFVKNYGSVLQTYATQKILENYGNEVEVVDYWQPRYLDKNLLNGNLVFSSKWNKNILTRIIYKTIKYPSLPKMCNVFNTFLNQQINLTSKRYFTIRQLKESPPCADIYMTGSDQVWNSVGNDQINRMYYLDYAPEGKKRIAFAASFGRSSLENWEKTETKELLEKYDNISMRESSGVEIVTSLGLNAVNILDPTLLLNKNDWEQIIKNKFNYKHKYLLVYMLKETPENTKYINKVAKIHKLHIIRLAYGYHECLKKGKVIVLPEVDLFLSLIKNAYAVITNSFHATAFSINFNIPFICLQRDRANSRINDLLRLLDLSNRKITNTNNFDLIKEPINYNKVNEILEVERNKAKMFLLDALK